MKNKIDAKLELCYWILFMNNALKLSTASMK